MASKSIRVTRRAAVIGAAQAVVGGSLLHLDSAFATDGATDPQAYVIWDAHGHLSPPGDTPRAQMDHVLACADRMNIQRLVVFMGYPFSYDPAPDELRRQNDQVIEVVEHAQGRVLGFVYLNPNPQYTQENLDELNRCVRDGPLVGVKLWVAVRCREACLDPLMARAGELKAPVLQHTWQKITGNLPGESTAEDLAVLAARHPETTFIAAHSGGDWELGIRSLRATTNVVAEICGGDPTAGVVEMAVRELGADRVIYGSDYPGRSFASQLAKVLGADLSQDTKQAILAGNLRRLLTPICAQKGITL